jgi:VWFA-related protein
MMNTLLALALAALASAPAAPQQPSAPRASEQSARTRSVYVSVLDAKDAPVPGLTVADVVVREDGVAREVLKVDRATAPLDVMLLVDDSEALNPALQPMREGIAKFIERLQGHGTLGLMTFGERPTSLVKPTTDSASLKRGAGRIFARSGAGGYLLEAIQEVSRDFARRKAERAHIVVVWMQGTEFSNLQYETVLKDLDASGAMLHVLEIGMPNTSRTDELRNLNMVVAEGTKRTGGRRAQVLAESGIAEALPRVADDLLAQYVVTYGRPERLVPPEKLQVTVSRPGVTVHAPTKVAPR